MRKLDISLGILIGMLALGIGNVVSKYSSDGEPAGIVVIALLLGCWLIILIVEGREKMVQGKNVRITKSGEQYLINLPNDIIDLTGWDDTTKFIVVPYIGEPSTPITSETPILIKKIHPRTQVE